MSSENMARKVVSIAAGETHTLALCGDGSVFSWGRGTFGRLGTGREDNEFFPVSIAAGHHGGSGRRERGKFVGIAAGARHSIALRDDGSVWSWGSNDSGQLGHGEEDSLVPCLVHHFQELGYESSGVAETSTSGIRAPLKISAVKAGGKMSFAIDSLGSLWMWGNCPQPAEDGIFSLLSSKVPMPVWDFHGHIVVKVACGNEHVVASVTGGETYSGGDLMCYAWGNNKHGQLGLGDHESRSRPQLISAFNHNSSWSVYEIACGSFHTAILAHRNSYDEELQSKCWTFGLGENGQLGHGTSDSKCLPEPVESLPQDVFLISLDCGLFHTSVVSSTGEVWSWGKEKGFGLCPGASFTRTGDAHLPLMIHAPEANGFHFPGPVQVACGAAHTVLAAADGYKLWAWGGGRNGVLGRGQLADSNVPCMVLWPPPDSNFEDEKRARNSGTSRDREAPSPRQATGMEQKLSSAMEELNFLNSKLTLVERYANVLHTSIFRKVLDERTIPKSLQNSGTFDFGKELENVMEKADTDELVRMEVFYRSLLSEVKEKLMKRRVQQMVKECLSSLSTRRQ